RPDDEDDVTVKLRPCRRSQLPPRWFGDVEHVKIEADWAGDRHMLAISNTAERPRGLVPAVVAGERPLADLLTHGGLEFLVDCASVPVTLDKISLPPPIRAVRWKIVPVAPSGVGLRAERWSIH